MFLRRIALVFVVTHFQSLNEFVAGVTGHNHLINQSHVLPHDKDWRIYLRIP